MGLLDRAKQNAHQDFLQDTKLLNMLREHKAEKYKKEKKNRKRENNKI